MNFSPRSRTTLAAALVACSAIASLLAYGGCKDDLAAPTQGTVSITLESSLASGFQGSRILFEDEVLVEQATESTYSFRLPAGSHRMRLQKDCAEITPAPEVVVEIAAGGSASVRWTVDPTGGIEVTSDMVGAGISLDGAPTGLVTPATLPCIPPGVHRVSIALAGADPVGPTEREITVSNQPQRVHFNLTPTPQLRGALLEVFTSTLCPNCPVADRAAELLWEEQDLVDLGYVGLEVHTRWGGTDPFNNATITGRNGVFRGNDSGNPFAVIMGIDQITGSGNQPPEDLAADYRARAENYLSSPSEVALWWTNTLYQPGVSVGGSMRLVLLSAAADLDTTDPSKLEVWGLYYKDHLLFGHPGQTEVFYRRVVREYKKIGDFASMGLASAGQWRDLDWSFDLTGDTRWTEAELGLVVFVMNTETKEIFQVVHRTID